MKTSTQKLVLLAGILLISCSAMAQFKYTTSTVIGQELTVDTLSGIGTLEVHFNTDLDSSYWEFDDASETTFTVSLAKCQTRKGLQVKVYDESGEEVKNKDFECNNYGGYRNPVRVTGIASVLELLPKIKESNAGTEDSIVTIPYNPAACLFDLDETGTDQAFGAYPGKYKRVEYGFYYSFEGITVLDDDIVFEMDTYDEGNTGTTASYSFSLAIGNDTNIVAEVADFYVSGSGKKVVKVAETAGVSVSDFANDKVYFFLKTEGTGTEISKANMDPVLVFDNFTVSYQMPMWIDPDAGISGNTVFSNEDDLINIDVNKDTLLSLNVKTSERLGNLVIINDREQEDTKLITFFSEGGLKANDGSGNYTVDVPYVFTPGDVETKATMVVAAPESGTVNDDMILYFTGNTISTDTLVGRIELDCGVRIWYDVYFLGIPVVSVNNMGIANSGFRAYPNPASDKIYIEVSEPTEISIYSISGSLIRTRTIDAGNGSINVSDLKEGVYFVGPSNCSTGWSKIVVK